MKARDVSRELDLYLTPDHVAEPKYDGVRMRLLFGAPSNSLSSGRRSVKTMAYSRREANFPHLRDAAVPELEGTLIDGELLAPGPKIQSHTGVWTDSLLNASVSLCLANPAGAVATQARFGKAIFWAFDCVIYRGESIMDRTYDDRRELLEQVVVQLLKTHPGCSVKLVPQWPAQPGAFERALSEGYEGVVVKRRDSTYQSGDRNGGWYKAKGRSTADAFIVGYSPGERGNTGLVGSLELAVMENGQPRPVAQVGNLEGGLRRALTAPDGSLREECLDVVIEFSGQALTKTGRVRSAQLVRIRPDKTPQDCQADQLTLFPRA